MSEIKGRITDIQRFSTGDGPGIRSTVFLKGCNLRCEWCHNPETISKELETLYYKSRCKSCGLCKEKNKAEENVCPNEALQLCGRDVTVPEIVQVLLEDKNFYCSSGGGVTFSGGEPLLQPDFIYEASLELKKHHIHIILDTALNVSQKLLPRLNPLIDCYYADLKGVDYESCCGKTGGNLQLILSNIHWLLAEKKDVVLRVPVIPGYSDSLEYMAKAARIVRDLGAKKVNLIPFHNYGSAKYDALDRSYAYKDVRPPEKSQLLQLAGLFENATVEF